MGLVVSANVKADCSNGKETSIERTITGYYYLGEWSVFSIEPIREILFNPVDKKCDIVFERVNGTIPDSWQVDYPVSYRWINSQFNTQTWRGSHPLSITSIEKIISMGVGAKFLVNKPTKTEWNREPLFRILRKSDRAVILTVYITGKLEAFPADIVTFNRSVSLKAIYAPAFTGINQPVASHAESMGIKVTTNGTQNSYIDFTSATLTSDGAFIVPSKGKETGVAICVYDQTAGQCIRPNEKVKLERGLNQSLLPYSLTYVKTRESVAAGDISGTLTVRLFTD
ncbi:hypothetical protein AAF463_24235 (plasmid) [Pantoea sp. BJ2]|uniref:Fimbrial protein n=1 Tax=Pantoea sp. BJ2 TaxID=3141322 RepID=A0AAU7U372_9GAMM